MTGIFIFHEMQQDSLLCGQHCLNNLLQQPIFNVVDLSNIAIELDNEEKTILSEPSTVEYLESAINSFFTTKPKEHGP